MATDELPQSLVVMAVSFTVCGIATYLWLQHRLKASPSDGSSLSPTSEVPDHLDEVLVARADAVCPRLPVTRLGAKPVEVGFSDGSVMFYFERDLDTYDRCIYAGLTPLDASTVDDAPRTIAEWTRREKVRWLADHPLTVDGSGA